MILAAALLLRLAFLAPAYDSPPFSDEGGYLELATSLVGGRGYAWANGQPAVRFAPLWPAVLALEFRFTGATPMAARTLQTFLGVGLVALIMLLARRLDDDPRLPAVAGWWAAASPALIYFSTSLFSETLFGLLLAATLLLLLRALDDPRPGWAALAGLGCGLMALNRGSALVFVPLAALWLGRRRRAGAALLVLVAALVVLPWTARNQRTFGTLIPVDNNGPWNLYYGSTPKTPLLAPWRIVTGPDKRSVALRAPDPVTEQRMALERFRANVAAAPGRFALMMVTKTSNLWGLGRDLPSGFNAGLYGQVGTPTIMLITAASGLEGLALLALAVWGLVLTGNRPAVGLQLLLVGYLTAIHALSYGHSRYRFAVYPLGYGLAALALLAWRHRDRAARAELWRGQPVARWAALLLSANLVYDVIVLELVPFLRG